MVQDAATAHITPEELAYFAGRLLPAREEAIEYHLGGCNECTEEVRQWRAFSALWDDWTGQMHAESWVQMALASALHQAQGHVESGWAERLERWHTAWAGKAQAVARLVVEATGRTTQVVTTGLESLVMPGTAWDFAIGAASGQVRGGTGRGQASVPSMPQARIRVLSNRQGTQDLLITVALLSQGRQQTPPLVLLIPTETDTMPRIAQLTPTRDGASWVARFDNVPSGEYLLVVEPGQENEVSRGEANPEA
jgi:hypothetical protein